VIYIVFHKIWAPLFFFYKFSKCWSILMKIISSYSLRTFLTSTVFLVTELQDQFDATRTGVQDQNEGHPRECIVDEWDKMDQRIMDKVVREWRKRLSLCGYRRRTV